MSRLTAAVNRTLDVLPPGRWLHRAVRSQLDFTQVRVPLRRGGRGLDGLRIAFISDVHAGSFMDERDLCAIFGRIAELQPDLVCLGGDLINTRDREILLYREPLRLLQPPLGVYAVPGNHDHFFGRDLGMWESFLKSCGVGVLMNRGVRLRRYGHSLWLCGVDDLTEGEPDLQQALDGARNDEPVLLLSHHPDFFAEAAAVEVDLTLSGHTHGGQIRLGGWAPINHSHYDYLAGLYQVARSTLYVGRGVGVTFLPLRIGARAEVPLLELATVPRAPE
jgi:predicted MPP superfamily phosphohydrolase